MKKIATRTLAALALALVGIQFIPVDRRNPPVETEVPASGEVRAILRRACYNCHSHESVWPWYSRIAPVSWMVANDVHEGRKNVNFSAWNRLGSKEQSETLHACWKEVEQGDMPLWIYRPLHPEARLSPGDRALLRAWSLSADRPE